MVKRRRISRSRSRGRSRGRSRSMTRTPSSVRSSSLRRALYGSSRSRSRSVPRYSQSQRMAATASGAALGYITGGVSGAYSAGRAAYNQTSGTRRVRFTVGRGYMGGKFKKPVRNKVTNEMLTLAKGYHITEERFGNVEDPHCAYLQHSTMNMVPIANAITGCLFRKLFQKAGVAVNSRLQELPLSTNQDSRGFRIIFIYRNTISGAESQFTYDTVQDDTITSLLTNFAGVANFFINVIARNAAVGEYNQEPTRMRLYELDIDTVVTTPRLVADMDLSHEVMTLFLSSKLRVQNRSSGAGATEGQQGDLDRVDIQPLTGKIFEHSNADPRLRTLVTTPTANLNLPLSRMQVDGFQVYAGSTLFPTEQWQEIPDPRIFVNCKKSSKVSLQPSEIKETFINYKVTSRVNRIASRMSMLAWANVGDPSVGYFTNAIGKSQTVGLQELIRTSAGNPIDIQYERHYKVGAISKTRKDNVFMTLFAAVPEAVTPP